MNNNYFDKNVFPGQQIYSNENIPSTMNTPSGNINYNNILFEQSSFENILKINKGKKATINMTFQVSEQSQNNEFKGIIEHSGKDHIILSEPSTGKWFLLPIKYINYITFDEVINYINF